MVTAVISIVGGVVAFVALAAVAAEKIGVWVFPTVILGAYLIFVAVCYELNKKEVKKHEVSDVGTNSSNSSSTGGVVKLNDLTVSRAIQEARARDEDPRVRRVYPDDV